MHRILLLEDDPSFGYILSEYLVMQDFSVEWVKTGLEARAAFKTEVFDLAILDIMVPGLNGFELAKWLQQQQEAIPFIFLSARSLKVDQLKGYKLGAYDYITKPVDEELLVAKIRVLLDRLPPEEALMAEYQIGAYSFDRKQFRLIHSEDSIKLTAREAALLTLLCQHQGRLLPRKLALQKIWGRADEFNRKSMDVFISHLRKYLAKDPSIRIENVHGEGFILLCQ